MSITIATDRELVACGLQSHEAAGLRAWFAACAEFRAERRVLYSNFGQRYITGVDGSGKDVRLQRCTDGWAAYYADRIQDTGQRDDQTIALRRLFSTSMGQVPQK